MPTYYHTHPRTERLLTARMYNSPAEPYDVGMPTDMFSILQRSLFFALLAGAGVLLVWVLHNYLMPVFWAAVFALILYPVYRFLVPRMRSASLASLTTILFALIVIFGPLFLIGAQIANEAVGLYINLTMNGGGDLDALSNIPLLPQLMEMAGYDAADMRQHAIDFARNASAWVASQALSIGVATFDAAIKFLLMLYLLFFFLRDGERLLAYIRRILPLGERREDVLFTNLTRTIVSIFKGTFVIAIIQGLMGAALFAIAGIGSVALWGVAMGFLSVIPAVGPILVWLPAGVILISTGAVWQGIVVLAGGAFAISAVDNVLRPLMVGRDTKMPDALILLSILGGLSAFGVAGLIIGPIIAALFLSVLNMFAAEYEIELAERG
ncbi:AI-2E family transporter [Candidatus Kaiserbacteria bacterium CG10_big_fil_rev_8_21_14_0_10_59_10]|uniref:AI-2E family transporter n=1 Tax=Candidatus Kaiserbacteria bacterium CG10_big_fil_rev_8_21_14_0_10_59_10 TaxID=1974612 RepID=A0A2H0U7L3_9BACT|nr:MAG: AI-2E family transporter [Candidatus Kaiserbacteria bacterium CG10_big_fil_rev_8_21_14_0_10_59_10]